MNPFDGGGDLYEFQCPDPAYRSRNQITNISIACNAVISNELIAGVELKHLFTSRFYRFDCPDTSVLAEDCIQRQQREPGMTMEEYFNKFVLGQFYLSQRNDSPSGDVAMSLIIQGNKFPGSNNSDLVFYSTTKKKLSLNLSDFMLNDFGCAPITIGEVKHGS